MVRQLRMLLGILILLILAGCPGGQEAESPEQDAAQDRTTTSRAQAPASTGQLSITYLGRATFLLRDGGLSIVTDPSPADLLDLPIPNEPFDVVTVTHGHGDHSATDAVAGDPAIISGIDLEARAEREAAGINFQLEPGFHDTDQGESRGRNTLVRWEMGDLTIAHMGDYGQAELSDEQRKHLENVDILFVPVGGFFTIDGRQAKELIDEIKPGIVIPMHYRTPGAPAENEFVQPLATANDLTQIIRDLEVKTSPLTVTADDVEAGKTKVWLLTPPTEG